MVSHWDYLLPFVFLLAFAVQLVSGMSCAYDSAPFMYSDLIISCETGLPNASCAAMASANGSFVGIYPPEAFNGTGALFTNPSGDVVFAFPLDNRYYEGVNYTLDAKCVLANGSQENMTGSFTPGQPMTPSWMATWARWLGANAGYVILFILGAAVLLVLLGTGISLTFRKR